MPEINEICTVRGASTLSNKLATKVFEPVVPRRITDGRSLAALSIAEKRLRLIVGENTPNSSQIVWSRRFEGGPTPIIRCSASPRSRDVIRPMPVRTKESASAIRQIL